MHTFSRTSVLKVRQLPLTGTPKSAEIVFLTSSKSKVIKRRTAPAVKAVPVRGKWRGCAERGSFSKKPADRFDYHAAELRS